MDTCDTCHADHAECVCGEYTYCPEGWGVPVTPEEHAAACERMDAAIDDLAPTGVTIHVRPAHKGEVVGVLIDRATGRIAHDAGAALSDALNRAWQRACEMWPTGGAK